MARQIIFLFFFMFIFLNSCNTQRRMERAAMKNQELVDKTKQKRENERMGNYEAALKKFYDQQTPKTRRELRRTMRQAERYNNHKKEFFLVRWYKSIFRAKHTVRSKANK